MLSVDKVRRFNFLHYTENIEGTPLKLLQNPDVTDPYARRHGKSAPTACSASTP